LATIGGIRIADRALGALREATSTQLVVANDPAARTWFPGVKVAADREPGLGPLAGIETALTAAQGSAVIVLAWDMPFVPGALLTAIRRTAEGGGDAVVPKHDSRMEPLCAWYAPRALHTCQALLASGERRAGALAEAVARVEWITDADIDPFGDAERIFTSVDSPDVLDALGGALR
jgi:molybdopterin-guanine dinucleotide biosynthesis protein A